jgi:hypothetical protein
MEGVRAMTDQRQFVPGEAAAEPATDPDLRQALLAAGRIGEDLLAVD